MPTAFAQVRCEEGVKINIIKNIDGRDVIGEIQSTVWHYDFVAKITSPDMEHLDEIIEKTHCNDKVHLTNVKTIQSRNCTRATELILLSCSNNYFCKKNYSTCY